MKIKNLTTEDRGDRYRIAAKVVWEELYRPPQDIYFETTAEYGHDLYCNPNSFLLACALPAMRYGEKRIAIDAPISPEIKDGLINAMRCSIDWYGGDRRVIDIEAPIQSQDPFLDKPLRAGCMFSGGIDALAMVRDNQLNFAPDSPRRIRDGILVYGILQGENESDPNFQNVIDGVSTIAADAGLNLIQVSTNIYSHFRDLDRDFSFWRREYIGSCLAAVAHAFVPRFSIVSIASTFDLKNLEPWGSHPILDPLYSSINLQIRHENIVLSRLEKTKLVGEWDVALKHLRVCNEKESYSQGNYNCGKCEKCVKTMTALLSLGLLEKTTTFVNKKVTPELLLSSCYPSDTYSASCYYELIEPLRSIGREDLVRAIEKVLRRYRERDLKGRIKRLDRALFAGNLLSLGRNLVMHKE